MTYAQERDYLTSLAIATFPGIAVVTAIEPIQLMRTVPVATASFDFLALTANHIFFLQQMTVTETIAATGAVKINAYDIADVVQELIDPSLTNLLWTQRAIWLTRLAHVAGTAGSYSIAFIGYEITYTA